MMLVAPAQAAVPGHTGCEMPAVKRGSDVRLGDDLFPSVPISLLAPDVTGTVQAIIDAPSMSTRRDASSDLEFTARRLVEVAVGALSPGINDPMTAISATSTWCAMMRCARSVPIPTGKTFSIVAQPSPQFGAMGRLRV